MKLQIYGHLPFTWAAAGCVGWGFVAYLASNAGWILFAWIHAHWGLLAQQIAFTASSLLGVYLWLWRPSRRSAAAAEAHDFPDHHPV